MSKKTNKLPYGTYRYYRCTTKRKQGKCSNHTIRIDKLEEAVLVYLQTMISLAVECDEVISRLNTEQEKPLNAANKALEGQLSEREKCQKAMLDLYPDWKAEIITQEEYLMLKANLQEKLARLDESIHSLQQKQENSVELNENSFVEHFKQHKNINRLTRGVLVELIDTIYVHEDNRITIKVKFQDELEKLLANIEKQKKVA